MRVALVHDWLDTWAGGEQVLKEVAALFPLAPIYTLVDFFPREFKERIGSHEIRPSFVQSLPFARTSFRRYLPLFPNAIESLDVSAFDLVISVSHAVAKGVRTHARQLHISYCLSPMRYAWDLREQYLAQVGLQRGLRAWLAHKLLDRLANWDTRTNPRVDAFVAISHHIAARIRRCYDRDATVIYPPVDVTRLPIVAQPRRNGLYITVSRLVPYKRIDAIAAAFRELPDRKLVIVGSGPERERVARAAGPNVRLLGQLADAERDALLAQAQAFIFAADEDFGIAPLEAQALGTPVIALRSGGLVETIRGLETNRPTGVFFDSPTSPAIADAVRTFERQRDHISSEACIDNAQRFSASRFRGEFKAFVDGRYRAFANDRTVRA
ncbi:MAG TPA: glycosyltransferase [Casimicrobiaceae bacterium]|nr:glycosyltransferase [Casimicrobiaceae bacterium]